LTEEKVISLVYKNIQYTVGDIVKLRPIEGITNPSGTIVISALMPPDMAFLSEVGTEWVTSCSLGAVKMIGSRETVNVMITGEEGVGMSYLAHSIANGSSICTRCGRTLTAPRSVACGYGPVCYAKLFGKPQPPAPGERSKTSKRSRKILEIDLSQMFDAREFFK